MSRRALALTLVVVAVTACKQRDSAQKAPPDRAPAATALPGAEPFERSLYLELQRAVAARGPAYRPRTRHQTDGRPAYTNRLIREHSPYLLQHAHNPVNWYPWGDEAFAAARALDRPVFLSIGYSTCHWCHVMEEESFEDPEIAAYLNAHFVAIKIDREQRPDVDAIYMTAVQVMTGGGGWPMTVFVTPDDRRPFFGGTYFPPRAGAGGARMGFLELMQRIHQAWTTERGQIMDTAGKLTAAVTQQLRPPLAGGAVDARPTLEAAAEAYAQGYDSTWGGLAGSPKFPSSLPVRMLLRYARRSGSERHRDMALTTLRKMAAGGIYDHVGGGFHRYSTDERWLTPHFEKMLYDNALLVRAYLDGYRVAGDDALAEVARDVLAFARRELGAPDGGFYSALDADSLDADGKREEGAYFSWTTQELEGLLGDDAAVVAAYYDVTPGGNFEGRSVLWTPRSLDEVAASLEQSATEVDAIVRRARPVLQRARGKRPAPLRDDKILTAWNGLMISALVAAEVELGANRDGGPSYLDQARRTATRVLSAASADGRLRRIVGSGDAAYLDDYAFVIAGLLDLFEATLEPVWLDRALALDRILAGHYEDAAGGFFRTADDHESLLAREKPGDDGAEPSGNSVMALNLMRLAELTGKASYRERADRTLAAFAATLRRRPTSMSDMLLAIDYGSDAVKEIVIVTRGGREAAAPLLAQLRSVFVPNRVLLVVSEDAAPSLAGRVPLLEGKRVLRGDATAYVCEQRRCELPTGDPAVFKQQLAKVSPLAPATPP